MKKATKKFHLEVFEVALEGLEEWEDYLYDLEDQLDTLVDSLNPPRKLRKKIHELEETIDKLSGEHASGCRRLDAWVDALPPNKMEDIYSSQGPSRKLIYGNQTKIAVLLITGRLPKRYASGRFGS